MFEIFEEFDEALHPFYGHKNYSKNCQLFKFIEEKEEEE